MIIMLYGGQTVLKVGLVMVINQDKAAADFPVVLPLFPGQMLADEKSYCLRPVGKCMTLNQFVQLVEKFIFK